MSAESAETGKQRAEEFTKAQMELLDKLQEANQRWLERMAAPERPGSRAINENPATGGVGGVPGLA
jgi:hypothetical protein